MRAARRATRIACGSVDASKTATMTSAGVVASDGGNMPRSPMTTRIRSSPSENPQAGMLWPEEHADQVVVPPAAAETAGQVGDVDLHDRARVVRQPAREAQVERAAVGRR